MVRLEYGNGKVEVTYSRSRHRSSSSLVVVAVVVVILLFDFIQHLDYFQRQQNCKYLCKKTVQFIYSVKVTSWL